MTWKNNFLNNGAAVGAQTPTGNPFTKAEAAIQVAHRFKKNAPNPCDVGNPAAAAAFA